MRISGLDNQDSINSIQYGQQLKINMDEQQPYMNQQQMNMDMQQPYVEEQSYTGVQQPYMNQQQYMGEQQSYMNQPPQPVVHEPDDLGLVTLLLFVKPVLKALNIMVLATILVLFVFHWRIALKLLLVYSFIAHGIKIFTDSKKSAQHISGCVTTLIILVLLFVFRI